jgi:hypothetical protein
MLKLPIVAVAALISIICALAFGDEPQARFKIATKRGTDKVEIKVEKGKAIVAIQSPFGISEAKIERLEEKWPDAVVLRLQLKGLENFKVSNGKVTINASVSSSAKKQSVRLWKDEKEDSPLDVKSPYWMEIHMIGADGKPAETIPLKDGYFDMQLPKEFFEGNPKSITLSWIDFYRN